MLRGEFLKISALTALAVAGTPMLLAGTQKSATGTQISPRKIRPQPAVKLGIDVLEAENFKRLKGLRIGLLTNPAGVNCRGESTIQIFHTRGRKAGVKLCKLFGPEHGIYGNVPAEKIVKNQIDPRTKLPVFSLYGATRKPTPEMLAGLDCMVVDLQDIGSRSYTFVSCLRYVIEACLEANISVMILDRPNPLGGNKVGGPPLEQKWQSYVGLYPTPYVHGLTIGELARAALGEGWFTLSGTAKSRAAKVSVVPMRGWRREMRWRQTGLRWIPTSPYINSPEACEGYAMTGLGAQLGGFAHTAKNAAGTIENPFRILSFDKKNAKEMATLVNAFFIRGLAAAPMTIYKTDGAYLAISNWEQLPICDLSFYLMRKVCDLNAQNPFAAAPKAARELWIKHVGVEALFDDLARNGARVKIEFYLNLWARNAANFQSKTKKYWLYS